MGKTKRNIMRLKRGHDMRELAKGDDVQLREQRFWIPDKKLTPYSRREGKFSKYENGVITKHSKLVAKNANRSLKKSIRQQNKKQLWQDLSMAILVSQAAHKEQI